MPNPIQVLLVDDDFKVIANILGARDALPADNEAIALPTKVADEILDNLAPFAL